VSCRALPGSLRAVLGALSQSTLLEAPHRYHRAVPGPCHARLSSFANLPSLSSDHTQQRGAGCAKQPIGNSARYRGAHLAARGGSARAQAGGGDTGPPVHAAAPAAVAHTDAADSNKSAEGAEKKKLCSERDVQLAAASLAAAVEEQAASVRERRVHFWVHHQLLSPKPVATSAAPDDAAQRFFKAFCGAAVAAFARAMQTLLSGVLLAIERSGLRKLRVPVLLERREDDALLQCQFSVPVLDPLDTELRGMKIARLAALLVRTRCLLRLLPAQRTRALCRTGGAPCAVGAPVVLSVGIA
jgi:hypothetical protein